MTHRHAPSWPVQLFSSVRLTTQCGSPHNERVRCGSPTVVARQANPESLAGLCGQVHRATIAGLPSQGPAPLSTWGFSLVDLFCDGGVSEGKGCDGGPYQSQRQSPCSLCGAGLTRKAKNSLTTDSRVSGGRHLGATFTKQTPVRQGALANGLHGLNRPDVERKALSPLDTAPFSSFGIWSFLN